MQHACHQCGASVADGTPFCSHCNAPQIKVAASEPAQMEKHLESQPETFARPREREATVQSRPIDWRTALPAIFFVAVPAGLLSFPLNLLFFLWTFGAGALTVSSYRKRTRAAVTTGMAVRLGFLSGVVAFAIFLVIFLIAMSRPDFGTPFREQMRSKIERSLGNNPDPSAKQAAAMLSSPNGMATVLTIVIGLFALLFILFSVLGAIAGATIFAPKSRAP